MVTTKHAIDCLVDTNSKVMDYHGDISYTTGLGENLSETLRMEMSEKPGSMSDNILRWQSAPAGSWLKARLLTLDLLHQKVGGPSNVCV